MRVTDVDVAIVGGGPAGLATALFLASRSPSRRSRIVVLEKERYPREKICAGALGDRADRLLASIGVRVVVPSATVYGLSVATSRGEGGARGRAPIGRVVRRLEFDRALMDQVRDRGIHVEEDARVTRLTFEASDGPTAKLETTKGALRARVVVGADGVGSFVRKAIGAPRGRFLAQVAEIDTEAAAHETGERRDDLRFDLTDGELSGYAWDFPTIVGGRALVCRGVYELRMERGPSCDVGKKLLDRVARLGVAPRGPLKRFAERGLSLHEPIARPRVLLVGEAAGIDPALGEGIAQAIFYGSVAGDYLADRLDRDDLGFEDFARVVARSRVGVDLRLRAFATPWLYGSRTRPSIEALCVRSSALARAGMSYFAGDRVPRWLLARAAGDLAAVALVALGEGRDAISRRAST